MLVTSAGMAAAAGTTQNALPIAYRQAANGGAKKNVASRSKATLILTDGVYRCFVVKEPTLLQRLSYAPIWVRLSC